MAFERAATAERMRVDRNGSVLAILLLRLPRASERANDYVVGALAERLRMTDTVGVLRDGRLGVLLPDTPLAGAWKVADDLRELLGGGGQGPDCEVLLYPEHRGQADWRAGQPEEAPAGAPAAAVTQAVAAEAGDLSHPAACGSGHGRPVTGAGVEALFARPLPWWKRATDICLGGAALAAASPLIVVSAAAAVLTSPGGAFFKQQREGLGGKRFAIFKIRTMYTDAEARKAQLRRHSEQDGPAFKMTNDPRVTPVGRVLRALSIDELPQLLNVVLGDMSLVGPRPLPVDESQRCRPWQRQRLLVTPGITCTWQVRGRNIVPFDDWVRMDLRYAREQSLWSDVKLLAETGPSLLLSKGPR
ncbi:MAG: sugar transferase [Planctomycetota bacterium]